MEWREVGGAASRRITAAQGRITRVSVLQVFLMREPLNQALFKGLVTLVAGLCLAPVVAIAASWFSPGLLGGVVFGMVVVASGVLALVVAVVSYRVARRSRRVVDGFCFECGYDLTGNTSGRCPECGRPTTGPWT